MPIIRCSIEGGYRGIVSAIDIAQPSDTIIIAPGNYKSEGTLKIPSGVTLDGSGATIIHSLTCPAIKATHSTNVTLLGISIEATGLPASKNDPLSSLNPLYAATETTLQGLIHFDHVDHGVISNVSILNTSANEYGYEMTPTSDDGYVITGRTLTYGGSDDDILITKFNQSGHEQWSRYVGGGSTDYAYDIIETSDGGLAVTGFTQSYGGSKYRGS